MYYKNKSVHAEKGTKKKGRAYDPDKAFFQRNKNDFTSYQPKATASQRKNRLKRFGKTFMKKNTSDERERLVSRFLPCERSIASVGKCGRDENNKIPYNPRIERISKNPHFSSGYSESATDDRNTSSSSSNLNRDRIKAKKILIRGKLYSNDYSPVHEFRSVGNVRILFENIQSEFVDYIEKRGKGLTMVGCVAWFRSKRILNAVIDNAARVSFIVNKEYYENSRDHILEVYRKLPAFDQPLGVTFSHMKGCPITSLKPEVIGNDGDSDLLLQTPVYHPVRCCGNPILPGSSPKGNGRALMHSKYVVFFDERNVPVSVATGSYNLSENAQNNIENMIIIEDPRVAMAYFKDFCNVYMISEKLPR